MALSGSAADHHVVGVVYEGFLSFETVVVWELFGRRRPEFDHWYGFSWFSVDPSPVHGDGGLSIEAETDPAFLQTADTIVIPGWRDLEEPPPETLLEQLRQAHARGARLVSICTGAFVLAATGLLDGRRATTHWSRTEALARLYPEVGLQPGVLYVDEGTLLSSAGSAAGIDLGLHLIRRDMGTEVANTVARRLVVPPHRDGGQAQFIDHPMVPDDECSLSPLLDWVRENLRDEHTVEQLAERACLSPRTFARRFQEVVGTSPHRWLVRERVLRAQQLLETQNLSVEHVAEAAGFGSAQVLRHHFRRQLGTTPVAYRNAFRQAGTHQ